EEKESLNFTFESNGRQYVYILYVAELSRNVSFLQLKNTKEVGGIKWVSKNNIRNSDMLNKKPILSAMSKCINFYKNYKKNNPTIDYDSFEDLDGISLENDLEY